MNIVLATPGIVQEKKSFLPIIALFTFVFSLVIYSSWYYLNINSLENNIKNVTSSDDDNNNFDYVKIEDKKENLSEITEKKKTENTVFAQKDNSEIMLNENSNDLVAENDKIKLKIYQILNFRKI